MTGKLMRAPPSFDALVQQGVYGKDFVHAPDMVAFYRDAIAEVVSHFPPEQPLCVLDAGCGTGAWLEVLADFFAEAGRPVRLAGFDLSEKMIAVARDRLDGRVDPACLRQGDALDPMAYQFALKPGGFDLILAYDLIQQLPRRQQARAVDLVISALRPGGMIAIFDHDRASAYGRKMGLKKVLTRYFFIPLVPRYYCNARYPALGSLQKALDSRTNLQCRLHSRSGITKLVLQITRTA